MTLFHYLNHVLAEFNITVVEKFPILSIFYFFPDSDSNLSLGGFEKSFLKINEKRFCHWISLWNEFVFPILLFFIMKKGFDERCVFFQNSINFMYKKQETWLIDSLNFFLEPHFFYSVLTYPESRNSIIWKIYNKRVQKD